MKKLAQDQGMEELAKKLTPTLLRKVAGTTARSAFADADCEKLANLTCAISQTCNAVTTPLNSERRQTWKWRRSRRTSSLEGQRQASRQSKRIIMTAATRGAKQRLLRPPEKTMVEKEKGSHFMSMRWLLSQEQSMKWICLSQLNKSSRSNINSKR